VFAELCRATAGGAADYSGMSYDAIDRADGLFWPCPPDRPSGTRRLFADRFPTASGRARFHATPHADIADDRRAEFPLLLTTGRVLAQYQSGTQTRRSGDLAAIASEPLVQIHPDTAAAAGIEEGSRVTLNSARGRATFAAQLTRSIRPDTLFAPFHWPGDQSANRLTNPALDPVSRMPEFKVCAVAVRTAADGPQPAGGRSASIDPPALEDSLP
jgi:assimilatory nitrate reductase catalytic subunit